MPDNCLLRNMADQTVIENIIRATELDALLLLLKTQRVAIEEGLVGAPPYNGKGSAASWIGNSR